SQRPEDEKVLYDVLTQKEAIIDDLIHYWQQLCLNWPVLTGDLLRIGKQPSVINGAFEDKGVSLCSFLKVYPVLFECLYAVFGAMVSNSRLCEQIHAMMQHGLKAQIGMDQADHRRQYSCTTDYGMREERRAISDDSTASREKRKKVKEHLKTKQQQLLLCDQLLSQSRKFAKEVKEELQDKDIVSKTAVKEAGCRVQDQTNLRQQNARQDAKSRRMTRKQLTIEEVR
ncbi:hypothetical protein ACHAWF_017895, partial [Thalassiosira exigua]